MWSVRKTDCGSHYEAIIDGQLCLVDKEVYNRTENEKRWCKPHIVRGYLSVRTCDRKVHQYLHRFVCKTEEGQEVDHINRNKLDCRKENLRACSAANNRWNRTESVINKSGMRGVTQTSTGKWKVRIGVRGQRIDLGNHKSMEQAIEIRKAAELQYYGEYAPV